MKKIGNYTILDTLFVDDQYSYYEAFHKNESETFTIKSVRLGGDQNTSIAQLQHEYYLLSRLNQKFTDFPQVVEFIEESNKCSIVFKRQGFIKFRKMFPQVKFELEKFFPIAISLAYIVGEIHSLHIIHKNLTPECIYYHPEDKRLIVGNFAISTELKRTMVSPDLPTHLQGTLEYMAPEQTGRMNRPLTLRADLYSLGIIFYEMLTGSVPFFSEKPMTIIHAHIANIPRAPHSFDELISPVLSEIVMKLLSKMAEDRYKSAIGLAKDLEKVFSEYQKKKTIPQFTLGEYDISTQLELPEKIYGREKETKILQASFDKLLKTRETKLISVKGYSGIGKTSLIRELTKSIVLSKGFFVSGKFDKFQHSDSYEALRQGLEKIVKYQLALPEKEYEKFKDDIQKSLSNLLGVITDFIPNLKKIVGEQQSLPNVGIEQSRNRFEIAIQRFIQVCSSRTPLVLFLDDLQWANVAMITMLEKLYLSREIKNLLIIISYRSNEVDAVHPLVEFLERCSEVKPVQEIEIEGLKKDALNELLQDMLYLSEKEVDSLAALMEKKTEGNPFFLLMLLEELYRDHELVFSPQEKRWTWNENKIVKMAAADNVVDFVNRRLKKLPSESLKILHLAACIGNTFTLEELILAEKSSVDFILNSLKPAIKDGLIIPSNLQDEWIQTVTQNQLLNREYHFQHDKIQQSCYERNSLKDTKKIHLEIARNWYAAYKDRMDSSRLMSIANQYNKGLTYVVKKIEKSLIRWLNHEAGKLAMVSAAYEAAYIYDGIAKDLSSEESWKENHDQLFEIHLNYVKSSFMSHHYDMSGNASDELFEKANNNLDKAAILVAKGNLRRAAGKFSGNIPIFAEGLKLLGYEKIGKNPNLLDVISAILHFKLFIKIFSRGFDGLPNEADTTQKLVAMLAERIGEECYLKGNPLRYIYSLMTWAVATYHKQNVVLRAQCYGIYSIVWPRTDFSRKLGESVIQALSKTDVNESHAATFFTVNTLFLSWHHPWDYIVENYKTVAKKCIEVGNLEFAAQSYLNIIIFNEKQTCQSAKKKFLKVQDVVYDLSPRCYILAKIFLQFYKNLCGDVPPNSWETTDFNEKKEIDSLENMHYVIGVNRLYINKIRLALHLDEKKFVGKEKNALHSNLSGIKRTNQPRDNLTAHFFLFLLEAKQYSTLSFIQRIKCRLVLRKFYHEVKSWVKFCPENFNHCCIFMEAEMARIGGRFEKALDLYKQAIEIASKNEIPEYVALAYQRSLSMLIESGQQDYAKDYAKNTIEAYEKWGANGVVNVLKKKYAILLEKKKAESEEIQLEEKKEKSYTLDARNIMVAADIFSKELQLEGLITSIMKLLVENIGATRGALFLVQKGTLWLEGYYDVGESRLETLTHIHWEKAPLCREIIQCAWKQEKEVVLKDVSKEAEFNVLDYFNQTQTKSLIAMPLLKGKEVIGIIYCENNVSTNIFTSERLDIIRALIVHMSISIENSRLYTTFEKFVPKPFLKELGIENIFDIDQGDSIEKNMNVLFIDIRKFTKYSENHTAKETFKFINEYLSKVGPIIHANNGFIDKFLGDGVMALFPGKSDDAVQACITIQHIISDFSKELEANSSKSDWHLRVGMGLHYAPLMFGVVGEEQHIEGTVIGDTVNVASRLESFNKVFSTECLISDDVKNNLQNSEKYHLRRIGQVYLIGRGKAVAVWQILDVVDDENLRKLLINSIQFFEKTYQSYLERDFIQAKEQFMRILEKNPDDKVARYYLESCEIFIKTPPSEGWAGEIKMRMK